MGALITSDYVVISDGSKIYLYYHAGGSPITAYYVAYDGTADKKSTVKGPCVHVVYLDASGILHEKVRSLPQGTSWEDRKLPDEIKNAPITTSRLSSGICHDNSSGAHQWVFFERLGVTSGAPEIAEIRSGSSTQFKWHYRKVLSEKAAAALPGTQLSTNLTDATTHLFFQGHDGNVSQYEGGYENWDSWKIILAKDKVANNTPLTATNSSTADKPYVFYASKSLPTKVTVYNDGKSSEAAAYIPGTKLGAVTFRGKVYLFQKPLEHTTSVWTRVYDGGAWKLGAQVIA